MRVRIIEIKGLYDSSGISKKNLMNNYHTKTIVILIILVLVISFGFTQKYSHGQEMPAFTTNNIININGSNLVIQYGITGGKLASINTDIQSKSLIISIQSTGNGNLTMILPRTLIDATENGSDTHFTVLINNHGASYDEVESFIHRTLSIPFRLGTDKIQVIGTQILAKNSNSSNPPPIIESTSTDNPPSIDGKWTTPSEWDKTKAVRVAGNGSEMYILAQHDSNFVYVMTDIVTDHTSPSDSRLMRYEILMYFDTNNYQGDILGSEDIGIGKLFTFINGTQVASNFGSEVWTYDNQKNSIDIIPPLGYNSSMGFSSTNDPFDSSHDHRVYEFRIPISLLHNSDRYGFALQAHACYSQDLVQCKPIYTLTWPSGIIISVPSLHGVLELSSMRSSSSTVLEFPFAIPVFLVSIVSLIVFYKIKFR
jgi:hypothetical protein